MDDELTPPGELCPPAYPVGAGALYWIVCERGNTGVTTTDLAAMIEHWNSSNHPGGPPDGLTTVKDVLDCADALTKGGYLRRQPAGLLERWTPLFRAEKPPMPDEQKRGDTP
jgi:hypothetical protein